MENGAWTVENGQSSYPSANAVVMERLGSLERKVFTAAIFFVHFYSLRS